MNLKCMIQILMLISTHPCQLITALYSLVPSRQKGKFIIYHASTLVHWFQVHVYYTCTLRVASPLSRKIEGDCLQGTGIRTSKAISQALLFYLGCIYYQSILLISFFPEPDVQNHYIFTCHCLFLKYLLTNMYKCIYFSEDKSEGYAIYKKKLQNYLKFILNHGQLNKVL